MPMFKKNLKLIATAIGLVAVLVMGLAMPGATQQFQIPNRGQIVQGISQLLATTLTASEGDILDVENTIFGSSSSLKPNPDNITFAYIPLHPSSRSRQLLYDWLFKDEPFGDYLYIGAFYVESDFPGCPGFDPLKAGIYHLKLRSDLKVVAVDSEGNEFVIGHAEKRQQRPLNATFKSTAPVSLFWRVLIALCAESDVNICYKKKECTTVRRPDGTETTTCTETEFCISC
jgi:hypothetical protein